MSTPIRVAIAHDHPMFRYGVVAALGSSDQVRVVGEAVGGRELLTLVAAQQPDVVLADLAIPDLHGASATRAMLRRHPGLGVVVLMMHEDDDSVLAALHAGARGYLLKVADTAEVVGAVLAVAAGHAVYGGAVAVRVAELSLGGGRREALRFIRRERPVLERLASDARNGHIVAMLGITDKAVRSHVSAILRKLQVGDRTAAALKARGRGISGQPSASG